MSSSTSIQILSGRFKQRKIVFTPSDTLRPTAHRIRLAIFNTLIHRYRRTAIGHPDPLKSLRVLDICAGAGGYGLEAISLGADHATFIDTARESLDAITIFCRKAACQDQVSVWQGAWPDRQVTRRLRGTFDLIFMDPPYTWNNAQRMDALAACLPWMSPGGFLILEAPTGSTFPESIGSFSPQPALISTDFAPVPPLNIPEFASHSISSEPVPVPTHLHLDLNKSWGRKSAAFYRAYCPPPEEASLHTSAPEPT